MKKIWMLALVIAAGLAAAAPLPHNLSEALRVQRELAAKRPTDVEVLNDLGNLLVLANRIEEAEEVYGRALGLAPDSEAIRYNLALLYQQSGRRKSAITELHRVLESNPRHAWAHYQLGTLHAASGRRSRAVSHYARAFHIDPSLTDVEVNPHIVENRLTTEAMLVAYRYGTAADGAPRLYQQPSHIADLLLPSKRAEAPAGTEVAPQQPMAASWAPPEEEEDQESEGEDEDEGGSAARQGGRVLTEEDLSTSRAGQVVSSGRQDERQAPFRPPPPRAVSPSNTMPGVGRPGYPGATMPTPSPGFRPALPSTGRNDLELIPQAEDRMASLGPVQHGP